MPGAELLDTAEARSPVQQRLKLLRKALVLRRKPIADGDGAPRELPKRGGPKKRRAPIGVKSGGEAALGAVVLGDV